MALSSQNSGLISGAGKRGQEEVGGAGGSGRSVWEAEVAALSAL